jgi:hypothetical protein
MSLVQVGEARAVAGARSVLRAQGGTQAARGQAVLPACFARPDVRGDAS